jgi:hypothetical protein
LIIVSQYNLIDRGRIDMKEKEIDKILVPFAPGEWFRDESGNYTYKKDENLKLISKIDDSKRKIKKSVTINDPGKKSKFEEVIVKYDGVDMFERIILTIDNNKTILPLVENTDEVNLDIKLL